MNNHSKQKGFTIIELMIATVIFTLVLMICLSGIMQITKMYYRAVTQNKTREVARSIIDEIGESIRFSKESIQPGTAIVGPQVDLSNNAIGFFCIGAKRYSFALDRQMKSAPENNKKQIRHSLWVDKPGDCSVPADLTTETPSADGVDLVSENMRLYKLAIIQRDSVNNVYEIGMGVAYGDDDLLSPRPEDNPVEYTCEGAFIASEFCATINLNETVQKRL